MIAQIESIIFNVLAELNSSYFDKPIEFLESTTLVGPNGVLDSMATMQFLVGLEDAISEVLGKEIVLADPKLARRKESPFQSIEKLKIFILAEIEN